MFVSNFWYLLKKNKEIPYVRLHKCKCYFKRDFLQTYWNDETSFKPMHLIDKFRRKMSKSFIFWLDWLYPSFKQLQIASCHLTLQTCESAHLSFEKKTFISWRLPTLKYNQLAYLFQQRYIALSNYKFYSGMDSLPIRPRVMEETLEKL